jgi:acetylornithine deacetylase
MPTALDYAKELVAFDSVSSRSNADVSDYVERALKALGFQVERLEYLDAAGVKKVNIVGKRAAGSGRGGLAYFAHTDVVPAGGLGAGAWAVYADGA